MAIDGNPICMIDSPGLNDAERKDEDILKSGVKFIKDFVSTLNTLCIVLNFQ